MKHFFIKLISICIAIIIIINVAYNLILADKLKDINTLLSLSNNEVRRDLLNKVREDAKDALEKENLINDEDKIILYKLYIKIKKEFETIDLSDK